MYTMLRDAIDPGAGRSESRHRLEIGSQAGRPTAVYGVHMGIHHYAKQERRCEDALRSFVDATIAIPAVGL
jgi:hypothetical protein